MKLYHSITVLLMSSMMVFVFTSASSFAGKKGKHAHSHSHAKGKAAIEKGTEISWDQCCEQTKNDTAKCQSMQNVTGKKQNKGTKEKPNWVASNCPEAKSAAPSADAKPAEKKAGEAKKEKEKEKKK
ncbi:MAG: hypothetical protein OXM55_04725 [Bdellovibrionales bacterium]|nr:hypothetical protein [Bdellovibrionales bacterium]